jgi:hypothetical protein
MKWHECPPGGFHGCPNENCELLPRDNMNCAEIGCHCTLHMQQNADAASLSQRGK